MCFYTSTSFLGKKPRNKNFFLSVSCTEIFVWVCEHIATLDIKWDRFSTKKEEVMETAFEKLTLTSNSEDGERARGT